jgi:3-phosphoglycerate kinase
MTPREAELTMKTVDDLNVHGRRVLLRADLNVPLDGTRIGDDGKVCACLPTLSALLSRGAAVVVCSRLGRSLGPDMRPLTRGGRFLDPRTASTAGTG